MHPSNHIQFISLKDYFGGESKYFTPWLSKNIILLNDIFQETNLILYKRELKVDKFYVDLSLRNENDIYIVENQYGESDHDHLGKCLVYSMLTNAKKTCWICETLSNEHLRIFRFLNIDLYIVELSIIKSMNCDIFRFVIHTRHSTRTIYYQTKDKGKTLIRMPCMTEA